MNKISFVESRIRSNVEPMMCWVQTFNMTVFLVEDEKLTSPNWSLIYFLKIGICFKGLWVQMPAFHNTSTSRSGRNFKRCFIHSKKPNLAKNQTKAIDFVAFKFNLSSCFSFRYHLIYSLFLKLCFIFMYSFQHFKV